MFSHSRVMITGGNQTQINHHNTHLHTAPSRGIDILKSATAPAAFHNSREREQFDPPKCHPHTREAILEKILAWVQRKIDTESFVMWLYGAAGAGKSAIAQSIAEICYKHGLLLATFFFSRSDGNRNNSERLVATIAYQMVVVIPESRGLVEASIENDPLIFNRSLDAQFTTLIVRPLRHLQETGIFVQTSQPSFIIIDGLDECMDGTQTHILDMISTAIAESVQLVFLVASRSEQDILTRIRSGNIEESLTQIALDTDYKSNDDIKQFLLDKFDDIKRSHPLRSYIRFSWPTYDVVQTLLSKSSGQFIYASTVIKYISSSRHRPTSRLDVILGIIPPLNDTPFAQLDKLYMHIISSVEDIELTIQVIAAIIVSSNMEHIAVFDLENLLGLAPGDISLHLSDLSSLIDITNMHNPRLLHASLGDFLFDRTRSQKFYVDPRAIHTLLARKCLQKLSTLTDVPIDHSGISFALSFGPRHLLLAEVTPELADELYRFPLGDILALHFLNASFRLFCRKFNFYLQKTKFEGVLSVHDHQRSAHDKAVISHLDKFLFSDVKTLSVLTEIGLVGFLARSQHFCIAFGGRLMTVLGSVFGVSAPVNGHPFPDVDIYWPQGFTKTPGLLHQFFADRTRSGRYAIDGETFAAASTRCIQYVLHQNLTTLRIQRWAKNSKRRPWLWRRRNLCRSIVSHIRLHLGYTFWTQQIKPFLQGPAYSIDVIDWLNISRQSTPHTLLKIFIALLYIPLVLEHSASSAELVALIENSTFRLPFLLFPKKTTVAQKALSSYLLRAKV